MILRKDVLQVAVVKYALNLKKILIKMFCLWKKVA